MKLILFDIDKTLIQGSKMKDETAFPEAFRIVYGINAGINIINPHGMTDQQIIIEVLKKKGLDEQAIRLKLNECMDKMVEVFNKHINKDEIIVLDGAKDLLEELKENNIIMGLVTGNLEPIARGKLKKVGFNQYFKFGGFGNEDIYRVNLVKLAIKKAEEKFNFKLDDNVFLVGDSPQDIKAGNESGVKTIGVTTGIYSKDELEDTGADFVVENLREVIEIVL